MMMSDVYLIMNIVIVITTVSMTIVLIVTARGCCKYIVSSSDWSVIRNSCCTAKFCSNPQNL